MEKEHQNDVNAMQDTTEPKKKHFILLGGLNLITEKVCVCVEDCEEKSSQLNDQQAERKIES